MNVGKKWLNEENNIIISSHLYICNVSIYTYREREPFLPVERKLNATREYTRKILNCFIPHQGKVV